MKVSIILSSQRLVRYNSHQRALSHHHCVDGFVGFKSLRAQLIIRLEFQKVDWEEAPGQLPPFSIYFSFDMTMKNGHEDTNITFI